MLIINIISTDEDPSLRIENFAIINLHGVFTKLFFNLRLILFIYCVCLSLFRREFRVQKLVSG